MSVNYANINLQGLNTNASRLIIDENNLIDCNNIVVDQNGIIGTRRGQEYFGDMLSSIKKLFGALGKIFVNAQSDILYESSGVFVPVDFPDTNTFDPESNNQIQINQANKSLFFNGVRVSSETGNPVDKKIKKLASTTSAVTNAGLEAPINLSYEISRPGVFANGESVAIRIFYQYTDENQYPITSPVSNRIVAVNDSGVDCDFIISYQIPVQYIDLPVNVYYAISNTVISPVTPDDNLFWSDTETLITTTMINVGLTSSFSVGDLIKRSSLLYPIDLYTNSTQEGILQNNDPPVNSTDIETFQNYNFYSNLKDRLNKRVLINEIDIGNDALTLDGITYSRQAYSNYNSYEFSGDTNYLATLDLCKAVTSTQTKYRFIFEIGDYSGFNIWTSRAIPPENTFGAPCFTVGSLVYIYSSGVLPSATNKHLYIYNTETQTWVNTLADSSSLHIGSVMGGNTSKLVLVSGHGSSDNVIASTEIYNISSNTWSTGTTFPGDSVTGGVLLSQAVTTVNGKIYCIGGYGNLYASPIQSTDTWAYDISGDTWTQLAAMPSSRVGAACASDDHYIYVVGGVTGSTNSTFTNSLYRYDIINNSWSSLAVVPSVIAGSTAYLYSGKIYLVGGITSSSDGYGTYADYVPDFMGHNGNYTGVSTLYTYNIADDSWSTSPNILMNGIVAQSGGLVGNTIYVLGGVITRLIGTDGLGSPVDNSTYPTISQSYEIAQFNAQLQERFIGDGTDIPYTSDYIIDQNFQGTSSPLFRFSQQNTVQFSKQGQPEAVPFLNNFPVGSANYPIKRIAALRTSLLILKEDGIYQLNGVSPETFSLSQLDPTFILVASQSVAKLNNEVYCLSNKGVVSINESGPKILSYKIKDLIDSALASVPQADWDTAITATAYEDDYKYIITIGDKTFTYNYVTDQWTIWHSGDSSILSWAVFNNYLYYANSTRVLKERKTLTSADFQTETGAGIDCSIQFNNLEFALGQVITLNAMQIQQREISGLTSEVTFMNDFNAPASNEFLLDKYICRTLPPMSSRMAFWFRPIIEWNTEIDTPGGTFSDLKLEGIDFEYTVAPSNIR